MEREIQEEKNKMNENTTIYDILKREHKDVKKLFKQIVDENNYQDSIYTQIKNALAMHIAAEEKVFYSRLVNNEQTRQITLEAYEEHEVGKKVINDIDASTDNDSKLARVRVLSEAIDQHIDDEEGNLFKKAKKVLSDDEEKEIARQFMNEKMASMPKTSSTSSAVMPNM